ncbi:hypothetical protein ACIRG5_38695 [Lentzea sp. NPDC102401]|uniref:hypothetical protein n=1 Tax=Lentzea sp. NPDC102401 TaxID=3364128 RepID=UPI00382B7E63
MSPAPALPGDECGFTNPSACVSEGISAFVNRLVGEALNMLLRWIGSTLLSTPTLDQLPRIGEIWEQSRLFVVAVYSLLVLVAGIVLMGHESVQSRYSVREIAPRVVTGFLAANLSLFLGDQAIHFANAASVAVLGDTLDPRATGQAVTELFVALVANSLLTGGLFAGLLSLVLTILLVALGIGYIERVALTVILLAGAPLALMCHGLPQTEGVARWFWRTGAGVLGIQLGQSLALICALKVFLQPGGFTVFGTPTSDGIVNLIVLIALMWILVKIPGWVLRQSQLSSGQRSFVGGLARAFVFGKAMGLLGGHAVGRQAATAASSGRARPAPAPSGPPWPAQPHLTPTPAMVAKRLQAAHAAQRLRAARHPRVPSQIPQFLQPQPQHTVHNPAVVPEALGPAIPVFSSAPTPAVTGTRRGTQPGSAPQFQIAGGPRREGSTAPSARPIRIASVPPQLRFQPATPTPPQPAASARPVPAPAAPVFRQAQPEPRIGDAYRRVHSVPPPIFRAPKSVPGGEEK